MQHFNYISCTLGDSKEYGENGMDYIPLYQGEMVDFHEAVVENIEPKLESMGYRLDEDCDIQGPDISYKKAGDCGTAYVCIMADGRDDDFMSLKATVFATTHEFDEELEAIEQWLKAL